MIESGIKALAKGLNPGESVRGYCPFCRAQDEKSFSVQRDHHRTHLLWFRCFRGKCGENGRVQDAAGLKMVLHRPETWDEGAGDRQVPQHPQLPINFATMIAAKYEIPIEMLAEQGCRYVPERNALAMPWRDSAGAQFGWVCKNFKEGIPKSHHDNVLKKKCRINYPLLNRVYKGLTGDAIAILVESTLDAYKILFQAKSLGLPYYPLALNGCHLVDADAQQVSELFRNVLVLLDPDMWPAGAIKVLHKLKPWNCYTAATTLEQDPKDVPTEVLRAWLPGVKELF